MKYTKPYFGKEVEDAIVAVVNSELSQSNKSVDQTALRRYIQAGKNTYENAILSGVADGQYLASVVKDEIAFKPKPPTESEIDAVLDVAKRNDDAARATGRQAPGVPTVAQIELVRKNARAAKLSHAINMVALNGRSPKLGVEVVDFAPVVVESETPTLETATA